MSKGSHRRYKLPNPVSNRKTAVRQPVTQDTGHETITTNAQLEIVPMKRYLDFVLDKLERDKGKYTRRASFPR